MNLQYNLTVLSNWDIIDSMEKAKYSISSLPIVLICILLCAGNCGQQESHRDGKIVLDFWQFWTEPDAKSVIDSLVDEFETANPNIQIDITDLTWSEGHSKIVVAFSGGDIPDILELGSDWVPEFSSRGALLDITEQISDIIPERILWEPVIRDGAYYGVPWFLDTRVIFFNKDLLVAAGYHEQEYPQTWSEFLAACRRIDRLGDRIHGFGANSYEKHRLYKKFLPFAWSNGAMILSSDFHSSVDSPEMLEALKYYLQLVETGLVDNQRNLDMAFMEGKLGFVFSGGWLLKSIEQNRPDLQYGVLPVPSPDSGMGISFAGGEYLTITSGSENPEAALKFVRFMTDPDNSVRLCKSVGYGFPGSKELPDDPFYYQNRNRLTFHKQLLNSRMPPAHPQWVYIEEIIEKMIEKGMYDKGTPVDLLRQADHEIKRILSEDN
ncbi:MAG: extracellular solute-binding protein [candidate division Zixibacteria bacterium]|nr:extracellular solute-binding protein [candidate division Zixibacteria bacterium]